MAKLTRADVLKLARLARLELSDEEVGQFEQEFNAILAYVEKLQGVDTDGLEPTSQVTGLINATRPDVIKDYGATSDELLKNVPVREGRYIKVKRMIT